MFANDNYLVKIFDFNKRKLIFQLSHKAKFLSLIRRFDIFKVEALKYGINFEGLYVDRGHKF